MSASKDDRLERIESLLGEICAQQGEINGRLGRLEQRAGGAGGASREEVLGFLDQFRAAESLGEASTGAWVGVSRTECLRGGLRTVQQREGMHARLLEERIKELGGSCSAEIPAAVYDQAMAQAGDASKPDAQKLLEAMQRFPDPDAALKPIFDLADRLDGDPETQSLLRTIAQDERSTLEFLQDACGQLNPS